MTNNINALLRSTIDIACDIKRVRGYKQADVFCGLFGSFANRVKWKDPRSAVSRIMTGTAAIPTDMVAHYADRITPRQPCALRRDVADFFCTISARNHKLLRDGIVHTIMSNVPACDRSDLMADDDGIDTTIDLYTRLLWYAICDGRYRSGGEGV